MTSALEALLEVQRHDTRLDQLRHLMVELPARIERDRAVAAVATIDSAIVAEEGVQADLAREQRRLEDEISSIGDKRGQVETKLYSGSVTNARELQDLQEDGESLARRIRSLEDDELVIMEKLEPVEAKLTGLRADREEAARVLDGAELQLTAAEAEIGVEVESETSARATAAVGIAGDLLSEYEKLRRNNGGIGVARLIGSQCGGCHLSLSAMEAARIRKLPAGSVVHCEECGRLLVA